MDTTQKSSHSHTSLKNEHGNYPKWLSKRKITQMKKVKQKKKNTKKQNQRKSKVWYFVFAAFDVSPKLKTKFFFRIMENSSTDVAIENRINGFHSADKDESEYKKFKILQSTDQIKELQTIIRDKETSRFILNYKNDMKQTRVFWW